MPIYAFECGACGHSFDRLQRLSDADPTDCPSCAAPQLRRQLTAPQFRLAGGGWYETDFKKDGDKKRNLADKPDAPAGTDKAAGKGDAKPDSAPAKTESKTESKSSSTSDAKPAPKPPAAAVG